MEKEDVKGNENETETGSETGSVQKNQSLGGLATVLLASYPGLSATSSFSYVLPSLHEANYSYNIS